MAYGSAAAPIRTHQAAEYDALARITHRMRAAASAGRAGFRDLVDAMHDNRRLWTLLAADVADDDNALPAPLRAQLFYLAEFTHHHTPRVLSRKASAEILVEINTAVMRGLRGQADAT
jgi:flagellar protein FlaF